MDKDRVSNVAINFNENKSNNFQRRTLFMTSEEKLIEGCQKGKKKFQKKLYESYNKKLFVVCLRYTRSRLDAEDVLQEAFIKIFANIQTFRGESSLEGWMKRIVINTALNLYRSKINQFPTKDIEDVSNQLKEEEFTLSNFSLKELLQMIQSLPDGCREIFNLYVDGFKHKEIAEKLNISIGTSKSQYSRAKVLLQEMIKKNEAMSL